MKKLYLILFALLLILPVQAFAAVFADISDSHPNERAIAYLKGSGVIQGYESTLPLAEFKPDNGVLRVELLKMVFLAEGLTPPATVSENSFPDVPKTEWFAPYVLMAKQMGTVEGYPDGTFKPGNQVNRAEAMKIILKQFFKDTVQPEDLTEEKLAELKTAGCEPQGFSIDLKKEWFWKYLNFANNRCVLDQRTLVSDPANPVIKDARPGDSMTRGEVAEMIFRAKTVLQLSSQGVIAYKDGFIPADYIYNTYKITLPPIDKIGYAFIMQDRMPNTDPDVTSGRLTNIGFNKLNELFKDIIKEQTGGVKFNPGLGLVLIDYEYQAKNAQLDGIVRPELRQAILKAKNFVDGQPCSSELTTELHLEPGVTCTAVTVNFKRGLILDFPPKPPPAGPSHRFKAEVIFARNYAILITTMAGPDFTMPQHIIGSPYEDLFRNLNQISDNFFTQLSVKE